MWKRRTFLLNTAAAAVPVRPAKRPNILFVLVDQWRAQAFGYRGDPNAHTPAIDALARESVNFVHAVSGFPVCSPYRASLMTGQYAVRNGVVVNDVPLQPNGSTLGECFQRAGYRTAYIGKWHLYGSPDGQFGRRTAFIPPDSRLGFSGYWKACECTHNYQRSLYYEGQDRSERYWPGYDARAQTDDACEFIRKAGGGDPYFLVLSLGPPHDPYQTAPPEYAARYANREITLRGNVPESNREKATLDLRGAYAHMAALDDCVAQLKQAVAESGSAENTILVFASDHGDMLQSQGLHRKQVPWDESIRVPFLVRLGWRRPEDLPRILQTPIDAPDIMPTLLGLAGIAVPESVQGRDYSGLITGRTKERVNSETSALLNLPASFSVIRRFGMAEYRGLRTLRYTYVRSIHGPWLLYDNQKDPLQKHNLVRNSHYAGVRSKLDRLLDRRLREAGDEFLPGARYVERARASHYAEVRAEPGFVRSPWGDWESNLVSGSSRTAGN